MAPVTAPRPRRSALYVPGSNSRALAKAPSLPADALILDLEDAVLPTAKVAARDAVVAAVGNQRSGRQEVVIRINGLDTEWGDADLRAAAGAGADGVLLSKVEGPAPLEAATRLLDAGGIPRSVRLWAMAETPAGILAIESIARSSPRLAVIVLGTQDLAKALRVPPIPGRPGLVAALSRCVVAARAAGVDILDGVYPGLADGAGFRAECEQGKNLGFDGKTLVHPGQIDAANEVFGISADQAAVAANLIAAWESAAAGGAGIAVVDGRMVERLHVEEARRQLALYRTIHDQSMST